MNNKSPVEKKAKRKRIKKKTKSTDKEKEKQKQKEKSNPKAEKKERKHHTKKVKKEGQPKKPASAYLLFCSDKRAEFKDKKLSAKELGEMYKELPQDKKDFYKKKI